MSFHAKIIATFVVLGAILWGCRGVPFYRMTDKASAGLVHSREGIVAFERGDLQSAERSFETALDLNEADIEVHRYYAETLWKQGERQKAIDVLNKATERLGTLDNETLLYQSLGEKLLETDQPSAALVCANKIIELAPKKYEGWVIRANAYWRLDRKQESLDDYQKALHFSPDNRDILWQIANLQTELAQFDRSLASWQHLERLYPASLEPAEVLYGKAVSYRGANRLNDALQSLTQAIAAAPDRIELYQTAAEIAWSRGDLNLAREFANQGLSKVPDDLKCRQTIRQIDERLQIASQNRSENRLR